MQMQKISQREQEVLKLVADEHSTKQIASKLYLSDHTVISHRKNLMQKLDVKNTAGMVRAGFKLGILTLGKVDIIDGQVNVVAN